MTYNRFNQRFFGRYEEEKRKNAFICYMHMNWFLSALNHRSARVRVKTVADWRHYWRISSVRVFFGGKTMADT